jgi:heparan-sulfate lyase
MWRHLDTGVTSSLILLMLSCAHDTRPGEQATTEEKAHDNTPLHSLPADEVLSKLNLEVLGLEAVQSAVDRGDQTTAFGELLAHYRRVHPLPERPENSSSTTWPTANSIVDHVFQWGPYEAFDYGDDIDWASDPRGDIEWVAAMYRFYWAGPLAQAYAATGDETYAAAFVELASDWIAKHPLEEHERTHSVYEHWRGFAWLDIQTGIRATKICEVFPKLVHAKAFTPEFLGILLASLYDHQVKTERLPMGRVHNKAIFEQRGFVNVAYTFPEFSDAPRWMALALDRTSESLLAQTTSDGVQREWSQNYHYGVLSDAVEIMQRADTLDVPVPEAYRRRVRAMYEYLFATATPDLGFMMFGDASRPIDVSADRTRWPLYKILLRASEVLDDPKYAARARGDVKRLPRRKSYAFPEAGMYVMRDTWGPNQIYCDLHCSPRGISSHDQRDNGTFELYAFGRWLLNDTGYYTYGHDPEGREWHRQTSVHQTLTLDGHNSEVDGRHLLWHTSPHFDALVVENPSYEGLTHRRSVWFVDKRYFVLLDEAIGDAAGSLDLHFQFAPGPVRFDAEQRCAVTQFDDGNVLVWAGPEAPVRLQEEEGWFAWSYGKRKPRKACRLRHDGTAPAFFVTVVVPFEGAETPAVNVSAPAQFVPGEDRVELTVQAFGKQWRLGRNLATGTAWCRPER